MIRRATTKDAIRIAEIIVFNYRLNFYPIFKNANYYFSELNVADMADELCERDLLKSAYVYDDGVVKGVVRLADKEIEKLFVEPCLQNCGIGSQLLKLAVNELGCDFLWVLAKNLRAIKFYKNHGFYMTDDKKYEEDTTEYLIKMKR